MIGFPTGFAFVLYATYLFLPTEYQSLAFGSL
jgi:hypothetical protein